MSLRRPSIRPTLEALEDRLAPATFLVANANDSGVGSLRQALLDANATKGTDTILFDIGGGGEQTISLLSALPTVIHPVIVDGTSQPGYGGAPLIVLDGTAAGLGANGLHLRAGRSTVKGLAIHSFDGAGILVENKGANLIRQNFLGTDASGTVGLGNGGDGLRILSSSNIIGGTDPSFGNLISANAGNGVWVGNGAKDNFLAANFIGTDVTGVVDLGNAGDGIAVVQAYRTVVAGTFVNLPPFVFKNVISGNEGNGIRVTDANDTVIHANFLGLGADNATPVGNTLSGLLVEGKSQGTIFGGIIPLGNVAAGNFRHGVEIVDQARGTLLYNTFAGNAAFNAQVAVGNALDGVNVTSTGGKTRMITNVVSGNLDDGIEISGAARDVVVVQTNIGTNTPGLAQLANGDNGIEIGGTASAIAIGGFAPSIIPQNVISGNLNHGIAILDSARDISIINSHVGPNASGSDVIGNGGDGIFVGGLARNVTIGGPISRAGNLISGNTGHGIHLTDQVEFVRIAANKIGSDKQGFGPMPNGGSGVFINGASRTTIGGTGKAEGNSIVYNFGGGVDIAAGLRNTLRGNSIHLNVGFAVRLQPGANDDILAPTNLAASGGPRGVTLTGTVVGAPNAVYIVELFNSVGPDPMGIGEGQFSMGTVRVRTDANGEATFSFTGRPASASQRFFSTNVTDGLGNTSEFAPSVEVDPFQIP